MVAPYSDYRENWFSKHRKVWRNIFILYFVFVKKQRTIERKKKRSKISGLESCYANRIYVLIGVELRPYGQKLVKFWTPTDTWTHASKLVVEMYLWRCATHQIGAPRRASFLASTCGSVGGGRWWGCRCGYRFPPRIESTAQAPLFPWVWNLRLRLTMNTRIVSCSVQHYYYI